MWLLIKWKHHLPPIEDFTREQNVFAEAEEEAKITVWTRTDKPLYSFANGCQ